MSAAGYDVVVALGREHNKTERLRARGAELEAALKSLVLENGHTYGCLCPDPQCVRRRVVLDMP